MLFFLGVLDKGCRDRGIILDESFVVPALTQEGSKCLQSVGDWPVFDDRGVVRGNTDPASADFVSEILDVIPEQLGLSRGDLETRGTESCQDFTENAQVALGILGVTAVSSR